VGPFAAEELADGNRLEALAPTSGAGGGRRLLEGAPADPAEE
jgi:hypothetical protein